MVLKNLLIWLCLLACLQGVGQKPACNIVLTGLVLSDNTNVAVEDAAVVVAETQNGGVTDSMGKFRLNGICAGRCTIAVTYLGSKTIKYVFDLKKDTVIIFHVSPSDYNLKEVEVISAKAASPVATLVADEIKGLELLSTRGLSLGESLKEIAGLTSLQMGPAISKPVINGLYGTRILVLNDGVRQEGQQWGTDHAPEVDPFIASQISVIKGASSIRYGADAMAGVILMEPAPLPVQPGIGANITLVAGSNGALGGISAYLEGAFGKKLKGLAWRIQGTLKRAGNFSTPHYYMWNTGLFEDDFSASIQYRKKNFGIDVYYSEYNTKLGIFAGADVHTEADLFADFRAAVPYTPLTFTYKIGLSYDLVHHDLLKTSAFYKLKNNGRLELVYAQQWDTRKEYDIDETPEALALHNPEVGFNIITSGIDLLYHHFIGSNISGTVGINAATQGNVYEGLVALIPNFRNYTGGIFWMEQYTKNKFTVEAGVRDDYLWEKAYILNYTSLVQTRPVHAYDNISFTAGVSYRPVAGLSVNLNIGSAFRPPDISELYINGIHLSDAAYDMGDSALKSERSYNTTASVVFSNRWVKTTVEGYFNYINNYIYDAPTLTGYQLISGYFPVFQYTQANSYLTGLNVDATFYIWKGLSAETKLAIIDGYNMSQKNYLPLVPANRWGNTLKYDFAHLKKFTDLYFSVSDWWVFKQNHYPPNTLFEPPPTAYALLNAGVGCSFPVRRQKMDISLTGSNLTNTVYRDYLDQFRYFTNGLSINAMLKVSFTLNYFKN